MSKSTTTAVVKAKQYKLTECVTGLLSNRNLVIS